MPINILMYTWQTCLITWLVVWHLIGNIYSIYVHRHIGHNHFVIHPVLEHVFRFWMWCTMGFAWPNWQQHWAAKHRKHHRYSDTDQDPNSPWHYTFLEMCDVSHNDPNRANYISAEEVKQYAADVVSKTDWVELNVYQRYPRLGRMLVWAMFTLFFGWFGFLVGAATYWGVKYVSIWGGNYANHRWGFRYAGNRGSDCSTIFLPWSIFFGGEEIHAHHHNDASKPYFHRHWWEIDTGWLWARFFMLLGLMKLR